MNNSTTSQLNAMAVTAQIPPDPVKELTERIEAQREFELNLSRRLLDLNRASFPAPPRDYVKEHYEAQQKIHERSLAMFTVRHHRSQF